MKSVRTRLLLGLLASVVVAQVFIYLLIYARIEDEIDDLFDAELERSALSANANGGQSVTPLPVRKVENPQQEMIVASYVEGEALSDDQPDLMAGIERESPAGFSKRLIDGRLWRLFSVHSGNKRIVA